MQTKPLLYNGYVIKENIHVNKLIERVFFTEIYLLSDSTYLYIFLDIKPEDSFWIENYETVILTIDSKSYYSIIIENHDSKLLSYIKEYISSPKWFKNVAWMIQVKQELMENVIIPLRNKEKLLKYKLSLPNGILFYGPPWCGKTYIGKKLAEEIGREMIEVKHSDVASSYIHWGVGKIGNLFEKALLRAPCVIFIDELSWLVPRRDSLGSHENYKEEEIDEFLINLDKAWEKGILVIGATNYPDRIDPAVLRSWRFDKKVFIGAPDFETRKELFKFYLNWRPVSDDIDVDKLSNNTY